MAEARSVVKVPSALQCLPKAGGAGKQHRRPALRCVLLYAKATHAGVAIGKLCTRSPQDVTIERIDLKSSKVVGVLIAHNHPATRWIKIKIARLHATARKTLRERK